MREISGLGDKGCNALHGTFKLRRRQPQFTAHVSVDGAGA
jgi:hypothetical protein